MNFTLIICTYQRPKAMFQLLKSVREQSLYPNQILIIDGSRDNKTEKLFLNNNFSNLAYYKVGEQDRGLTKQRNYGISKVGENTEIVCFLDDDVVLLRDYFEKLINSYSTNPDAVGVGGYILNEVEWKKNETLEVAFNEYEFDGWSRKLGGRNKLRKKFGLLSDKAPGIMPEFSHGLSTSFLPPSGKIYPVEFFMGGVASYRKTLFENFTFSKSVFYGWGGIL